MEVVHFRACLAELCSQVPKGTFTWLSILYSIYAPLKTQLYLN